MVDLKRPAVFVEDIKLVETESRKAAGLVEKAVGRSDGDGGVYIVCIAVNRDADKAARRPAGSVDKNG
jgi:hypothetical protein